MKEYIEDMGGKLWTLGLKENEDRIENPEEASQERDNLLRKRFFTLTVEYATLRRALNDNSGEAELRAGVDGMLRLIWHHSGIRGANYR